MTSRGIRCLVLAVPSNDDDDDDDDNVIIVIINIISLSIIIINDAKRDHNYPAWLQAV